jgi:hypothetical protein
MAGRLPIFDNSLAARVVKALRAGNTRQDAAEFAAVGKTTFYRWLAVGRKSKRGRFREFWNAVKKAEAAARVRNVGVIRRAARGGTVIERTTTTRRDGTEIVTEKLARPEWTAAAWHLERRTPEDWGSNRAELTKLIRDVAELKKSLHGARRPRIASAG